MSSPGVEPYSALPEDSVAPPTPEPVGVGARVLLYGVNVVLALASGGSAFAFALHVAPGPHGNSYNQTSAFLFGLLAFLTCLGHFWVWPWAWLAKTWKRAEPEATRLKRYGFSFLALGLGQGLTLPWLGLLSGEGVQYVVIPALVLVPPTVALIGLRCLPRRS